ncbi:hypothetical protein RQP46_001492 [Phenoliferia psychrophenolica]
MAGSKPTAPYQQKKGGFKVGPRLAKGSYTGHTKKIKDTLIHKATIKRQYYKDLKAEGYGDGHPVAGTGSNGGKLGERGTPDDEDEDEELDDDVAPAPVPAAWTSAAATGKGKARSAAPSSSRPTPSTSSSAPLPTPSTSTSAAPPPPAKRPRLSEPEIKLLREKKKGERQDWVKRGARGQPKLGGRVEMLLGRIKKSME